MIDFDLFLNSIDQKSVMERYVGHTIIPKKHIYTSPIRPDRTGKCFYNYYRNKFYLYDFAYTNKRDAPVYDVIEIVALKYNTTRSQAVQIITDDLKLNPATFIINKQQNSIQEESKGVSFKVHTRPYQLHDKLYWQQFGIDLKTLKMFNVKPIQHYDSNANGGFSRKYTYNNNEDVAYLYSFDSGRVKIYRPNNKEGKWRSNSKDEDVFGLNLLHKEIEEVKGQVIISSGQKDLMCLKTMGFYSIAPQSEGRMFDWNIILELVMMYDLNVIFLYDNDETGIKMMQKRVNEGREFIKNELGEEYIDKIFSITLPKVESNNYKIKDVADFVREFGKDDVKSLILDSIKYRV